MDFTHRTLRVLDKPVHRLGLALNMGIDAPGVESALERGVNYLFLTRMRTSKVLPAVKAALRRDRERFVLATGPSMGFTAGNVRRGTESILRRVGVDYVDVLQVFWAGRMSALTDGVIGELVKLREEGKARAIGLSIHDRARAGQLAEASPFDLFMIRYNAAHPGAEKDIFPHLATRQPSVVAYTATSWRSLLRKPSGWTEREATAGDCYRFCLSNPNVDVVLTGARSRAELDENLAALERGPLSPDEDAWIRRLGQAAR